MKNISLWITWSFTYGSDHTLPLRSIPPMMKSHKASPNDEKSQTTLSVWVLGLGSGTGNLEIGNLEAGSIARRIIFWYSISFLRGQHILSPATEDSTGTTGCHSQCHHCCRCSHQRGVSVRGDQPWHGGGRQTRKPSRERSAGGLRNPLSDIVSTF